MNVLVLDDNKSRLKAFRSKIPSAKLCMTAQETTLELAKKEYDIVFLDHDLGGRTFVDSGEENTGMEVVRWIIRAKPTIDKVVIHSHNPAAAYEMGMKLKDAGYTVEVIPFIQLLPLINKRLSFNGRTRV